MPLVETTCNPAGIREPAWHLQPAVACGSAAGDQIGLLFYPQNVQYAAIVSAEGLSGGAGIVSYLFGVQIPPVTSSLEPVLGLAYDDPYSIQATDVELPIFVPGQYADSQLTEPAS